jgi:hypothetical protein
MLFYDHLLTVSSYLYITAVAANAIPLHASIRIQYCAYTSSIIHRMPYSCLLRVCVLLCIAVWTLKKIKA